MAGGMRPGTAAAAEVAVRYQPSGRASHPSAGWRVAVRWPFRKVPLATSVVLLLLLVSVALRTHPQGAEDVVAWSSTNVHNLAHHPIAALLVSAFVIPGGLLSQLPLVAAGLGMVERAIGSLRTLVVAAAGHVLPTLLTEYGAAASGHLHLVAMSSPYRSDVGISYVTFAALGAAACLLTGHTRILSGLGLSAWVAVRFLLAPGMTTIGHLLSLATGAAVMCWFRHRAAWTRDEQLDMARVGESDRDLARRPSGPDHISSAGVQTVE